MSRSEHIIATVSLGIIAALYIVLCVIGMGWGLPSSAHDDLLFGDRAPWSGARIVSLSGGGARHDPHVGADVDITPLDTMAEQPLLNADARAQAQIYRRYRLFTRQPDEMITMMALSGMSPRDGDFDPKLYQYGGLFIYPVGACIKACGILGLFPVHGDLAAYLDHPRNFAKFYVVARVYAAAWGLAGLIALYAIGKHLGGRASGVLAALFFAVLPVVTCMSHEAKPHLPGAVLMLYAVLFGMRALDRQTAWSWVAMFVSCGAAVAMVLSSAPILILVPLVLGIHCRHQILRERHERPQCKGKRTDYRPLFVRATVGGWIVAGVIYLITNPYIGINLFKNRQVLASNFGNSLAMYDISRCAEGFVRVCQLTLAGATWPVVLVGCAGLAFALRRRNMRMLPLVVPAALFAAQFVLIGAGKPDEYGRFGIFYECALAVGCACVCVALWRRSRFAGAMIIAVTAGWCAVSTTGYLWSFHLDATGAGSRDQAARFLAAHTLSDAPIALIAEPAPYGCPELDFAAHPVVLYRADGQRGRSAAIALWNDALIAAPGPGNPLPPNILIAALDDPDRDLANIASPNWHRTEIFAPSAPWIPPGRISWANKPIAVLICSEH